VPLSSVDELKHICFMIGGHPGITKCCTVQYEVGIIFRMILNQGDEDIQWDRRRRVKAVDAVGRVLGEHGGEKTL